VVLRSRAYGGIHFTFDNVAGSDTNEVLNAKVYTSSTTGNAVYSLGLFDFDISGIRVGASVGNDRFDLLT
jgi:hypothetical protein